MLEILLADDEPSIRLSMGDALRSRGYSVALAGDGAQALGLLEARRFDVVIADIRMPKADGRAVFRRARELSSATDVILVTAYGAVSEAVKALKEGAHDYLTKPFDVEELLLKLGQIAQRRQLERELAAARAQLQGGHSSGIVGRSPSMVRLLERLETLAPSDAPVLVTGESGTGKELVARSLHASSPRRQKPFVAVNCAAFPETLLEAELFGHERGAFTGAVKRREGRFKAADGGTLMLDEISEIPLPAQAKLLRVLQEGIVEPLGTNAPVAVDVRIVSASNRNLKQRVAEGRFREDLYYRLNVLDLSIPPLRERRGDIPLLVEFFLKRKAGEGAAPTIAPRAWAALSEYSFPGNVRELEHAVEHAVVLSRGGPIDLEHLPQDIVGTREPAAEPSGGSLRPLAVAVKEFEREYLVRALAACEGRKVRAAEMLGISRKNLWEKLKAHGLGENEGEAAAGG
jgi:DNA-binding NtrC family response regulator